MSEQAQMVGMIGLGKMGAGMAARLVEAGLEVKSFDPFVSGSATSLEELAVQLSGRRVFWMMIPHEPLEATVDSLIALASPGDIIIDGGNSNFRDSKRRAAKAAGDGIHYLDVGVSGGVWGQSNGYPLMIGGEAEAVAFCEPIFAALAGPAGHRHLGPSGAGHFVKAVHNGIEYGMMGAYAEGFALMEKHPDFPDLDLEAIAELWNKGSVIRSWLLELLQLALADDPSLEKIAGWVDDTGEGRWTMHEAIDAAVPTPVLAAALYARFASRGEDEFAAKVCAALRHQFGGHAVKQS